MNMLAVPTTLTQAARAPASPLPSTAVTIQGMKEGMPKPIMWLARAQRANPQLWHQSLTARAHSKRRARRRASNQPQQATAQAAPITT